MWSLFEGLIECVASLWRADSKMRDQSLLGESETDMNIYDPSGNLLVFWRVK